MHTATVYSGTVEELHENDGLVMALTERERAVPFLDGMDREALLERLGQAEAVIREETNVMAGCLERLHRAS